MTDSRTHQMLTLIQERTYDLQLDNEAGRRRAAEVRESLMAELTAIRPFLPRTESLRLEVLIERLTGAR